MMHVTFLDHSGFLVELPGLTLLFDWWQGDLPPLPSDPLLVFASHRHPDHFDPRQYLKPARQAVKDMVTHKLINVLGCNGKA